MNKINPTIARIDRAARQLGVPLRERGVNGRELTLNNGRVLYFRPGGKGIVKVEAYVHATRALGPDCVAHRSLDYMLKVLMDQSVREQT